jgi:hypothetical protein
MKLEAYSYEHEAGVSLSITSETDVEEVLLRSLWKHGVMVVNYNGFAIRYRQKEVQEASKC